jgi:hypothetical protein
MALKVQDTKKCRKNAKMENCTLSQWNRWVATDIHLYQRGDWYVKKHYTYIRVYGSTGIQHLLSKYVSDKLLAREIA